MRTINGGMRSKRIFGLAGFMAAGLLAACATSFDPHDPVDRALKICGLGYSAGDAAVFKGAYEYALGNSSLSLSAGMNSFLDTQTMDFIKRNQSTDPKTLELELQEVQSERKCVVDEVAAYPVADSRPQPKTQTPSQLMNQCIDDFKKSVGDMGPGQYPRVEDTALVDHADVPDTYRKFGPEDLAVVTFVNRGGSESEHVLLNCEVKGNVYQDFKVLAEKDVGMSLGGVRVPILPDMRII